MFNKLTNIFCRYKLCSKRKKKRNLEIIIRDNITNTYIEIDFNNPYYLISDDIDKLINHILEEKKRIVIDKLNNAPQIGYMV
jgi:hypothetical protein